MKKVLFLLVLLCICYLCIGTTYTSMYDLPNYNNVYTLSEGDVLNITGNLTILNNQTLIISAGSQFIVSGNLTIKEKGTLQLSSSSKTVIYGNLYQDGDSPLHFGWILVDIGDIKATNATVVVCGEYNIWHDTEYSSGTYLNDGINDVYIFKNSDIDDLGDENDFKNKYGTVDNLLNPVYPKCYNLKKENGDDLEVCTDAFGDINIDLSIDKFKNIGNFYVPEDLTVECRNFYINTGNYTINGINSKLINNGTIVCTNNFSIDNLGYISQNNPYFETSCSSKISANEIHIGYVYDIAPFNGIWLTSKMIIENGQGQDISFTNCSYVKANEIDINANISNGIMIEGHIISDKILSSKDIYLKYTGTASNETIITLGTLDGYHSWDNVKIIADEYTTINICSNPIQGDGTNDNDGQWNQQPNGADRIGYTNGNVLYNYGEGGWIVNDGLYTPIDEWDINPQKNKYGGIDGQYSNYKALSVVPAYKSYSECINETVDILLGIEIKDTLQENKNRHLYDLNPCGEDFEKYKVQIRELGNKWFRYINGELFYCENDNF